MSYPIAFSRHVFRPRIAAVLLTAASLTGWSSNATAHDPAHARRDIAVAAAVQSLAELEAAFWACDHAATVHGILDAGIALACGVATESLRRRKFDGDFEAMLSWWQQNKARHCIIKKNVMSEANATR